MNTKVFDQFISEHGLPERFREHAQLWFTPLVEQIQLHKHSANQPMFIAINGCQGSGKSTLAALLAALLNAQGPEQAVAMSLDDFYLSKAERKKLSHDIHPLFATRGVPGTHNTALMQDILSTIGKQTVRVPKFDKAIDDICPQQQWPLVSSNVNFVIIEGWCMGAKPQADSSLSRPINALEQNYDTDATWRRYVNQQLQGVYADIFAQMHFWIMLKAPSFSTVTKWRQQQEHALRERLNDPSAGMSDAQISKFVAYFERITQVCLTQLPASMNVVFELDGHRHIQSRHDGTAQNPPYAK